MNILIEHPAFKKDFNILGPDESVYFDGSTHEGGLHGVLDNSIQNPLRDSNSVGLVTLPYFQRLIKTLMPKVFDNYTVSADNLVLCTTVTKNPEVYKYNLNTVGFPLLFFSRMEWDSGNGDKVSYHNLLLLKNSPRKITSMRTVFSTIINQSKNL